MRQVRRGGCAHWKHRSIQTLSGIAKKHNVERDAFDEAYL